MHFRDRFLIIFHGLLVGCHRNPSLLFTLIHLHSNTSFALMMKDNLDNRDVDNKTQNSWEIEVFDHILTLNNCTHL